MVKHNAKLKISISIIILAIVLNLVTGWILWYGVGYFFLLLIHYQNGRIPAVIGLLIMIFVGVLMVKTSFWLANLLGTDVRIPLFIGFWLITTVTAIGWRGMKNDLW